MLLLHGPGDRTAVTGERREMCSSGWWAKDWRSAASQEARRLVYYETVVFPFLLFLFTLNPSALVRKTEVLPRCSWWLSGFKGSFHQETDKNFFPSPGAFWGLKLRWSYFSPKHYTLYKGSQDENVFTDFGTTSRHSAPTRDASRSLIVDNFLSGFVKYFYELIFCHCSHRSQMARVFWNTVPNISISQPGFSSEKDGGRSSVSKQIWFYCFMNIICCYSNIMLL